MCIRDSLVAGHHHMETGLLRRSQASLLLQLQLVPIPPQDLPFAGVAPVGHDFELGEEARELLRPIVQRGGGCHDQERAPVAVDLKANVKMVQEKV